MGSFAFSKIYAKVFLKWFFFFVVIISFSASPVYGENLQKVFPLNWEGYRDLKILYLESGLSIPSTMKPFSADEVKKALDKIDFARLSLAGKLLYKKILNDIKVKPLYTEEHSAFALDIGVNANLESYLHSNENVPWQYGYEERLPIFSIPFDFWLFNNFYANLTLDMKEEHRLVEEITDNHWNLFSMEHKFKEMDMDIPFRAFSSVGGKHWRATYGRDKMEMGNGITGNLFLSDNPDFFDFLFVNTYWRYFKFSAGYIYLEPWLTPEERAKEPFPNRVKYYGDRYKALMFHRFEFRFWERVNLSIMESILFGGMYPQLRDFNYLALFHSWEEYERTNGSLEVDLEINPYRYVNLYGQFYLMEYQTEYEENTNSYPTALGYLAGIEGFYPLFLGYLNIGTEWVRTDPLLYNRYNPFLKYIARRRIWSYYPPDGFNFVDKPLGYYLGPDVVTYSVYVGYSISDFFEVKFDYQRINKGEMTIDSPYLMSNEAKDLSTPTGVVEYYDIFHVALKANLLWGFSVGTNLYYIDIDNFNHTEGNRATDWQWVVSVSYSVNF